LCWSHARYPREGKAPPDVPRSFLAARRVVQWEPLPPLLPPKHPGTKGRKTTPRDAREGCLSGLPRRRGMPHLCHTDQRAVRHLGWPHRDRASQEHRYGRRLTVRPSPDRFVQPDLSSHSSVGMAWRLVIPNASLN